MKTDRAGFCPKIPDHSKISKMWWKMRFFEFWQKLVTDIDSNHQNYENLDFFWAFAEDRMKFYQNAEFWWIFEVEDHSIKSAQNDFLLTIQSLSSWKRHIGLFWFFQWSENLIKGRQSPSQIVQRDLDHSKIQLDHSKNEIFRFLRIFKFWRVLTIIA